ncbi:MAG: zinc ABC transporter ATP-binding protein [Nitrosarchaeum sp.]|nr:metal ABC transporter ATP-binding protein [Nitrosarchaeum sp.]PHY10038.1 MAG: zinc ABC transporter ATP-binding protein [Nitrosarchaeum sp.]
MIALEVKDISISYNNHLAVDKISFDVQEGDLLGIVGPNGAGKTTLFRAILGLEQYSAGKIKLFGFEGPKYHTLLSLIGYVPQRVEFEPNFPATVSDIVSMGIISDKTIAKGAKLIQQCGCCWNRVYKNIGNNSDKIIEALRTVGLEHLKNRRIGELSGGELQRVFIAKSLVKDPILLILDEPVTSVDVESQTKFYNVIKKINEENKITVVWSSHDLEAISKYANRVACMNRKLFFHGAKEKFFSDEDLLKTYTESAMQMHMHNHNHDV